MDFKQKKIVQKEFLISVIIPAYNSENYIKRCLESILVQTYTNYELIVVDDGSTDNTLKICRELQNQNEKIKIIEKENGGVSSARNVGLANTKGEYIAFIDSDDYVSKEYLEILVRMTKINNAEMSICGVLDRLENGKILNKSKEITDVLTTEDAVKFYLRSEYFFGTMWAKLIRKDVFEGIFFNENIQRGEDFDIFLRLLLKCKRINIDTKKYCYNYIVNDESLVRNSNPEQIFQECLMAENISKLIDKVYPNLHNEVVYWFYSCCLNYNAEALKKKDYIKFKKLLKQKLKKFFQEEKEFKKQFQMKHIIKIFLYSVLPCNFFYFLFLIKKRVF